jgi:ribosomal protein S21
MQVNKKNNKSTGMKVDVYNNNIELALKKLKRKVKDSNLMQELRSRQYFIKKSDLKRQKRNMSTLRQQYQQQKQK